METPNPANKKFNKKGFHKELVDYLQYCPTPEKESAIRFLEEIYSINIHTLCTGDAIDIIVDSIDISDDDIDKASLVNFLITTQIRTSQMFNDIDRVMDDHLSALTNMVSGIGHFNDSSERIADSIILKYVILLRIYLDLNLIALAQDSYYDNGI